MAYGIGLNPSSLGSYPDGVPRIRLGSWFYSFGGSNDGTWQCVGARMYCPAGATNLGTIRLNVNHWHTGFAPNAASFDFNSSLITQSKEVEAPASPGWVEVMWDTPFTFADSPASFLFVWYEFIDSPGQYEYDGSQVNTPIESTALPGLFLANYSSDTESRSYFTQAGTDGAQAQLPAAGARNVWYGAEPLVDTPAGPAIGAAGVTFRFDVSATGTTPPIAPNRGAAAPTYRFNVSAFGQAPILEMPTGAAVFNHSWQVSAYVPAAGGLSPDGSPFRPRISSYAKTYLRLRTTDLMNCEIKAYKPGTQYDPVSRRNTSTEGELIYQGPARVWEVPASAQVVIGDEQMTVATSYLSVPWETPSFTLDTMVLVVDADDPDLIGRTLNIESSVRGGGLRSSRRFQVSVSTSKRATW